MMPKPERAFSAFPPESITDQTLVPEYTAVRPPLLDPPPLGPVQRTSEEEEQADRRRRRPWQAARGTSLQLAKQQQQPIQHRSLLCKQEWRRLRRIVKGC